MATTTTNGKIRYIIADQDEINVLADTEYIKSAIRINEGSANTPLWFLPFDIYAQHVLALPEYIIEKNEGKISFSDPPRWLKCIAKGDSDIAINGDEARSYLNTGYYQAHSGDHGNMWYELKRQPEI